MIKNLKLDPKPYTSGMLAVSDGHELFWQEWGNPDGIPLLFLHGGPGCGFSESYLELYDLTKIRLITFDQRGSGKSRPLGRLVANDTFIIIEDIERLRTHRKLSQWYVTGHSWGTTLAILYASKYQKCIKGVLLAGLFGARRRDHIWCLDGIQRFYPEELAKLRADLCIPDDQPIDLVLAERIATVSEPEQARIARHLTNYFRVIPYLSPLLPKTIAVLPEEIAQWSIFLHFAKHNFFLDNETGIFDYVKSELNFPIILVHGRYDMDCPPDQALQLRTMHEGVELIIPPGNHDLGEEPMASAYRESLKKLLNL